jgi:transcription elongation factor GreB
MAKNYITPLGWRVLIDELTELITVERPRVVREVSDAAAEGDRSENAAYIYGKRRLREIDRRAGFLQRRLALAEVVDGRKQSRARVFFGALVEIEDEAGETLHYQVVGVDEVEAKVGRVSWESPLGKALLGRKVGDSVRVQWHAGERELEIVSIDYRQDPPPGDSAAVRALLEEGLDSTLVDSIGGSEATVSGDEALPRRNGSVRREVGIVGASTAEKSKAGEQEQRKKKRSVARRPRAR